VAMAIFPIKLKTFLFQFASGNELSINNRGSPIDCSRKADLLMIFDLNMSASFISGTISRFLPDEKIIAGEEIIWRLTWKEIVLFTFSLVGKSLNKALQVT